MSLAIPVLTPDHLTQPLAISPTDISQFVRLDQCERYLRLRLHERVAGTDFLRAYDVAPQSIPPLLTQSGAAFEREIEETVRQHLPAHTFTDQERRLAGRTDDNQPVLDRIASLAPGQVIVLFQPRLQARLDHWQVRGDVDILRLSRGVNGLVQAWIVDMKSTTTSKVEHRMQVAFYRKVVEQLIAEAGLPIPTIELAILFRGPDEHERPTGDEDARRREEQIEHAIALLGAASAQLEHIEEPEPYLDAVHDLVTGKQSTANRVLTTPFDELPFHLNLKCDGCAFNELCLKRSDETRDLSLLPHITAQDKQALHQEGIFTIEHLASLKDERPGSTIQEDGETHELVELVTAGEQELISRRLSTTWPVGPRLDELIHRARAAGKYDSRENSRQSRITGSGYSSMPYTSADQNPNLVRVYLDAQHDHLQDRVYLLGALIIGYENGRSVPHRRRSVVHLSDGPPESGDTEERLFLSWIEETLQALIAVAAPDSEGRQRAPIHLTFMNDFAQQQLLAGLARHAERILGATALYDFVTQIAAFDSSFVSLLDAEIRRLKLYPMVCQSLQSVAAFLKFDWSEGVPYRQLFRERMFDYPGMFIETESGKTRWYTRRARFDSQIPLEYAYAAWHHLETPQGLTNAAFAPYLAVTPELLTGFHARRLEAMEHIAADFHGNQQTTLTAFDLPDLTTFEQRAETLAQALDEFVTIERHVDFAEWKRSCLPQPEQRVLAGTTLVVRYLEDDQDPGVIAQNRENERRRLLRLHYHAVTEGDLSKEQKAETKWSSEGLRLRLRLETTGSACTLDEAIALSTLKPGERLVLFPRFTQNGLLPAADRKDVTPTPKQLMYGVGVSLDSIEHETDDTGITVRAWAHVTIQRPRNGSPTPPGFIFGTAWFNNLPLQHGAVYTLDIDPNDHYSHWMAKTIAGLKSGGANSLYSTLAGQFPLTLNQPQAWITGQQRFMQGLRALHDLGAMVSFEPGKQEFIGDHATTPLLLVQGPPGTGKSFTTAYALLARMQGAMAADRDFRVLVSCKTHAATNVLIENVRSAQRKLEEFAASHPKVFAEYFDFRLIHAPLFRYRGKEELAEGIVHIPEDRDRPAGTPKSYETVMANRWTIVGLTAGGVYSFQGRWKDRFSHRIIDCVVLDEASQMSIPEAIMATLPLKDDGMLMVVGDPRQMPPIVKNDWSSEKRRTFQAFRSYESLFSALLPLNRPIIKFAESFRLHADMAAFLQQEIYRHDQINYHSNRREVLDRRWIDDDFVAAVLLPEYPITVIVHDEHRSQHRNRYEQELMTPLLHVLADPVKFNLAPEEGLGVVVPHRAQRAALQQDLPMLSRRDEETGAILISSVDTVERFQGGERTVILIGATESDRAYLQVSGDFLLNPQRLTVALSRARKKLVLVASRSVFEMFSADETTFANAQMWKNLLRKTCTVSLWEGTRHGHQVEVWGNHPS